MLFAGSCKMMFVESIIFEKTSFIITIKFVINLSQYFLDKSYINVT